MADDNRFSILLVEPDSRILSMIACSLEAQFGVSIFEAEGSDSAMLFLSSVAEISLVIIGDLERDRKLLDTLAATTNKTAIPAIVCLTQKIQDPALLMNPAVLAVAHRGPDFVDEITALVREKFFSGEIVEAQQRGDFYRVQGRLLLMLPPLTTDVYIRLSAEKYLKIFRAGDRFDNSDFEKYCKQRHVEHFYVKRADSHTFLMTMHHEINRLLDSPATDALTLNPAATGLQTTIHNVVQTLGVTEEVRLMTQTNVKVILKMVEKTPQMTDVLNRLRNESGQYIVDHSVALAQVSCMIAAKVSWLSDLTFQKLIIASLFHDITLNNHQLAKVRTLEEAEKNKELLLLDTLEDFRMHPIRAADIVNSLGDAPADVDSIIRQHHEKPDGSGFPNKIAPHYFSPLSCVMILAHDYVDFSLESDDISMATFIRQRRDAFSHGYFKNIIKALDEAVRQEQA